MPGLFPMRLPQNSGFLRKGRWRAFRMTLIEVQQPFRADLAWRPSRESTMKVLKRSKFQRSQLQTLLLPSPGFALASTKRIVDSSPIRSYDLLHL